MYIKQDDKTCNVFINFERAAVLNHNKVPCHLYARYLCSREALGLKAKLSARDDRVSCIQSHIIHVSAFPMA